MHSGFRPQEPGVVKLFSRDAEAARDGEVRHVGNIGGDLAALNKALRLCSAITLSADLRCAVR
jgi:CO/xanthine dehydrogenase FAD-binding subunit